MKLRTEVIALSTLALIATAGCTPSAREDVSQAGANIGSATEKSVEGTAEAADKAGDKMAAGAQEAASETAEAADKAGDAIAKGASNAAEAVGGAAAGVAKETQDAGQVMSLTPKIKNALVVSKIDASTIDVDTSGEKDTVHLKGTVATAAQKALAEKITKQTLMEAKSNFKVVNELKVGSTKM